MEIPDNFSYQTYVTQDNKRKITKEDQERMKGEIGSLSLYKCIRIVSRYVFVLRLCRKVVLLCGKAACTMVVDTYKILTQTCFDQII